jgi:aldehyde:ferredoxin oxidoreductase
MKPKGYIGKVLEVDLSSRHMKVNEVDEEILYKYIGARGLGIRLLTDLTAAQINPLSPQNPLIFMTGPYNGTGVFSAFFNVTTKAPLTGISGSSHCGGKWGPRLKGAGFDGVVVKGASESPCYLFIEEGNATLLDGQEIWGKGTMETERILLDKHKGAEAVVIGQAGEKLVKFAAIMNGQRAAARGGVGAVMGSKKLKAIVVRGKAPIEMFDRDKVLDISKRGGKLALENGKNFARYGTSMAFSFFNEKGVLPTRNFREGTFPEAEKINAEALKTRYFVKDQGCFNCPLRCANVHRVPEEPYKLDEVEGPEYETLMSFGPNCNNANLESILMCNYLCNDLGLDTISCGNLFALLMDLFDLGIVHQEDLGGVSLLWGDHSTVVSLIPKIAFREGIGQWLAEGSWEVAKRFGSAALSRVIHSKKQDFSGYEPRRSFGTGFSLVTSNRGADHLRATFYVNEVFKGELDQDGFEPHIDLLLDKEHLMTVVDSLCMCKFGQRNGEFTWPILAELLSALTGFSYSETELKKAGERIWNLERLYNLREGLEEDMLPTRFFEEDMTDELEAGKRIPKQRFISARALYYEMRGWNEKGEPDAKKLKELDLETLQ